MLTSRAHYISHFMLRFQRCSHGTLRRPGHDDTDDAGTAGISHAFHRLRELFG